MGCGASKDSTTVAPTPSVEVKSEPILTFPEKLKKVHACIRWNKPMADYDKYLNESDVVNGADETNGNTAIHIAAQNGHIDIVKILFKLKANLNAVNLKGNTPLHMAIGYDYYDVAKYLLDNGCDGEIKNSNGHAAKLGLEGDKSLACSALASASTLEDFILGMTMLEADNPKGMDKANFIKYGLKMKKNFGDAWNGRAKDQFTRIISNW